MAFDVDRLSPSIVGDIRPDRAQFRETPMERIERWALGLAWAARPQRIGGLPALGRLWLSDLVAPCRGLPDPERTLNAGGLCGMVHDLAVPTLVEAYKRGLFTFAHLGPLKWVSPPERCVLYFDEAHIARRLRRQIRQGRYNVTFDRDFVGVIKACAGRRDRRWHVTWITPRIMRAYADMFDAGRVHSFEVWNEAGALAGIVSGSGPTCTFLCASAPTAVDVGTQLSDSGVCRTVRVASGPVHGARVVPTPVTGV